LVAIGCAAVANRLAHFHLKNCGVWFAAAARQIAGEPDSHRVSRRLTDLRHTVESPTRQVEGNCVGVGTAARFQTPGAIVTNLTTVFIPSRKTICRSAASFFDIVA
jgi:hypothetical protein